MRKYLIKNLPVIKVLDETWILCEMLASARPLQGRQDDT